jgi:SEC-C motif domain protein
MRSRFSAFFLGDEDYLLRTWHPATRPPGVAFDRTIQWERLEVLETSGGGFLDDEGTVRFVAHYRERGREARMEEHSRFVVQDGAWLYVGPLPAR